MPRILIVDDDDEIRALLRRALEAAGYEVDEASDGRQGVKLYREKPADLLIVDIFMPEKEGLETLMDIRRDFPAVKSIAISGGGLTGSYDYLTHAESFGAARTFTKPFKLKEMLGATEELIGAGEKPPYPKRRGHPV